MLGRVGTWERSHCPLRLILVILAWGFSATSGRTAEPSAGPAATTSDPKGLSALGGSFDPSQSSPGDSGVRLFGMTAEGSKFVYVLDRSNSTGGGSRTALAAIKAELEASIDTLDNMQQFQLVFYNETPTIFNPSGKAERLAFATESNKERAKRFVRSLVPSGGTAHADALRLAIRMQPSVIFLLTDAGEPQLQPSELDQIRRWAAGVTINVVEFGQGPASPDDNFLKQLARQNNGQHVYVDLHQLTTAGAKK